MRTLFWILVLTLFCSARDVFAQWVQTNGPFGGTVNCFTVAGGNIFAGTESNGVFRSTDNGASWVAASEGLTERTILVLTTSAQYLFAGTYHGVFRSSDNGNTWAVASDSLTNASIGSLAVCGTNLFVGTRTYSGPPKGCRVLLSTDNGTSWTTVHSFAEVEVTAMAFSGTTLFAAVGGSVYRSTDNGASWAKTALSTSALSLAVSGSDLFAGTSYNVFRSTDNGETWASASNGLTGFLFYSLAVSGTYLFAGAAYDGFCVSTDKGSSWTVSTAGLTDRHIRALAVGGTTLFAGTYDGVFLSSNNGTNWNAAKSGLISTTVWSLAVSGTTLFAGMFGPQTSLGGVSLSTDQGSTWTAANVGLTSSDVRALALDGTNIFAGTMQGGIFVSTDGGASWSLSNHGLSGLAVTAFAFSGIDLYAACSGAVAHSIDHGKSWEPAVSLGTINSLAGLGTTLFAGNQNGVFRSTDDGWSWTSVNVGLTDTSVRALYGSGAKLFAGTYGGAFVSADSGSNWNAVSSGLTSSYVWAFAKTGPYLFAGTSDGVSLSTDDGAHWSTISTSNKNVTCFAVSGFNLFAGTQGGGVYKYAYAGSLVLTLRAEDPWGLIGPTGRVEVFNYAGALVGSGRADSNSVVSFVGLLRGNGYSYRVYKSIVTPWGEQFLGEKQGIAIGGDLTTYDTFTHNTPHMPRATTYIDATNEVLPEGAMVPITPGTRLRIELEITNPAYDGSEPVSAYGGLHLDRDKTPPYDVTLLTSSRSYAIGTTKTVAFYVNAPDMPGVYYLSLAAFASSNRYEAKLTDATGWHDPSFTVTPATQLPPWWFPNTGRSHTIVVPTNATPNISGTALSSGDYVGVFYDSSGTLACAGYERWTGNGDIALSAFGDDSMTVAKDGFTAGEVFQWKIFRASEGMVYDAEAVYVPIGGVVTSTNAYVLNGMSQLSSLIGGIMTQCQGLRAGWSLLSSYVTPQNLSLDSIFKPIVNDVIIVKNGAEKTYSPSVPADAIGSWVNTEGYQIKMANARTLCFTGQKILPWALSIGLPLGWSIMPYVLDSDMPIATGLGEVVGDMILLKSQDAKVYIPSLGVNGIGTLKVGQAYQIKMASSQTIEYSGNTVQVASATTPAATSKRSATGVAPTWFFTNTGTSQTVIVPGGVVPSIEGTPLTAGDYIGLFYDSTGTLACAGYDMWNGSGPLAVSVFGDDATTAAKDGFAAGELLRWKIWRLSDEHVFTANASYMSAGTLGGLITDTSRYATNGISALTALNGSLTSVRMQEIPTEYSLMQNYPNPFNPSTTIRYGLPKRSYVTLRVFNTLGQQVAVLQNGEQEPGYHEVKFDGSGLSSGLYFYRMEAVSFVQTHKLLLLK